LVDDGQEFMLDMLKAAGASFVSLSFADRTAISVDPRRIVGVKGSGDSTLVYIDGFSNRSDEGGVSYSIAVTNSRNEILTMIHQAKIKTPRTEGGASLTIR
jgi:hypothetical protein